MLLRDLISPKLESFSLFMCTFNIMLLLFPESSDVANDDSFFFIAFWN